MDLPDNLEDKKNKHEKLLNGYLNGDSADSRAS